MLFVYTQARVNAKKRPQQAPRATNTAAAREPASGGLTFGVLHTSVKDSKGRNTRYCGSSFASFISSPQSVASAAKNFAASCGDWPPATSEVRRMKSSA